MNGKFVCSVGNDGKRYFALKASNGETILSSQGYADSGGCDNGIESVRANAPDASNFRKETASNGKFYFTLVAGNGQVIGTSQMYASEASRDAGIASVGRFAPDASVVEHKD